MTLDITHKHILCNHAPRELQCCVCEYHNCLEGGCHCGFKATAGKGMDLTLDNINKAIEVVHIAAMKNKPSNPHAFPIDWNDQEGMTLLDYFAAKAMQAGRRMWEGFSEEDCEKVAGWAYQQAEAMLKEREKHL